MAARGAKPRPARRYWICAASPQSKRNSSPCRWIATQERLRSRVGTPLPVPRKSVNLAFVSQFVEIPDDVVFTVEYSVRAAQMAIYQLMKIDRPVPPVTRHDKSLAVIFATLEKAFT